MAVPADVVVNYATNPAAASATGYAAVAGTGGTAALSNVTTGGPVVSGTSQSVPTFERVTWSVATTAPSGGCSYTQARLAASTTMPHMVWVRSSKAQTVALTVQYQTAGGVNVGSPLTGAAVALTANTWTALTVTLTSGATVAQAVLTAAVTAAGANWAASDTFDMSAVLIQEPVTRQNLALNPSFEASSGTVTVRQNLCTNPSVETSTTGYASNPGSGGAVSVTRGTDGGYVGTGYYRTTWTTANTATGYIEYDTHTGGLTAGTTYTFSAYLRSSSAITMYLNINWSNGTAPVGTPTTGANVTIPANTWTRVTVTGTAPTGAVGAWVDWYATTAQILNQTIDIDAVLIENVAVVNPYFDGSTAAAGDYTYGWTGTANASTSTQSAPGLAGPGAVAGNSVAYQSADWNNSRGHSARVTPTSQSSTDSFFAPGGDTGGMRLGMVAGQTYTASATVRLSAALTGTLDGRSREILFFYRDSGGNYQSVPSVAAPNVAGSTRLSVTVTIPTGSTEAFVRLYHGGLQGAGDLWWDDLLIEQTSTLGTYFDGSYAQSSTTYYAWEGPAETSVSDLMTTPFVYHDGNSSPDSSYRYKWQGTANASLVMGEYRGVWVELASGSGAPAVQVSVSGTGVVSAQVTITRTADNETWTVPGWNNRVVIDADTLLDSVPPLARTVTYTAFLNGIQLNQMSITVPSSTGWVQDPWDPSTAMPVDSVFTTTAHLCLAAEAMGQRVHGSDVAHGMLMGSKRQYALTNTRQMDDSVTFSMYAHQNDVSDAFRALVANTPILLFRGLPSWGSVPGLAYTDGPAKETMLNRQRVVGNGGTTHWDVSGPLIQPVTRQPLVSTATYTQMATALANTTYTTIAARSGSKRYIDIKANPLGL